MFGQPQKPVREKSDDCEIIIEKTARGGVRKRIRGSCTSLQLKALSENRDIALDSEEID